MFDVAFSELMVIAVVALIVIGPEKLPKVARTVGHLAGRMQRYANQIKQDVEREMQSEDLKQLQNHIHAQNQEIKSLVETEVAHQTAPNNMQENSSTQPSEAK